MKSVRIAFTLIPLSFYHSALLRIVLKGNYFNELVYCHGYE